MKVGDTVSWERTFTEDDIRLFNDREGLMSELLNNVILTMKTGGEKPS